MNEREEKAIYALKLIELKMGAYSKDRLTFANNTIRSMELIAKKCLDELGIERDTEEWPE